MAIQRGQPKVYRAGVYLSVDNTYQFVNWVNSVKKMHVLVGPSPASNERSEQTGGSSIGNMALAYIHEYGSPAGNIPARPFIKPGIQLVRPSIVASLRKASDAVAKRNMGDARSALQMLGIQAVAGVRRVMLSNVPPPLTERTLADRRRRGNPRETTLLDTMQLYNSMTYQVKL